MITAVDTSVLLDIFTADPSFAEDSAELLRSCMLQGKLIACEVVVAEISVNFPNESAAQVAMQQLSIDFSAMDMESSLKAGAIWKQYRRSGGTRGRIISDFLVGSHAVMYADRLLTRDRGFYRNYFSRLKVLDPSTRNKS